MACLSGNVLHLGSTVPGVCRDASATRLVGLARGCQAVDACPSMRTLFTAVGEGRCRPATTPALPPEMAFVSLGRQDAGQAEPDHPAVRRHPFGEPRAGAEGYGARGLEGLHHEPARLSLFAGVTVWSRQGSAALMFGGPPTVVLHADTDRTLDSSPGCCDKPGRRFALVRSDGRSMSCLIL
jgi:hypothetical protein